MGFYSVIQFTLGFSIFLMSLRVMSQGLQGAMGKRLQRILERLTTTPLMGVLTGTIATIGIQSSSAVAVTMVALVNAGILDMSQAFGIILGANIGTTITAQIVAFDFGQLALPLMICGLFLLPWNRKSSLVGRVLVGFGGIFFGLTLVRGTLLPLIDHPLLDSLMRKLDANVYLGILVGSILTALVQSSSAVTGMVIALAQENAITLGVAITISLGANIGTVATTLLSSIGLEREAKATAYADLIFNVSGVLLLLPVLPGFVWLITLTSPSLARQIANAHTLFNLLTAVVAVPFIPLLAGLAWRLAGISRKYSK